MSTPVKVSAFAAALAAVFVVAWTIGSAVGPLDEAPAPTSVHERHHEGRPGGTP